MAKRLYSVPFHTATTEVYEVLAASPAEAAYFAGVQRSESIAPSHSHTTSFRIGTVKATLPDTYVLSDEPLLPIDHPAVKPS